MKIVFLRQRIFLTTQFVKMISLIFILFSICGCASLNSTNYLSRIKALTKVKDQNILFKVAKYDGNHEVKLTAFNKITDQSLVNRLARESEDSKIRLMALNKVTNQDILFNVASNEENFEVKLAAFNKITDQKLINSLASDSEDSKLCLIALNKVSDQNLIIRLALNEKKDLELRRMAIQKITDQNILYKMVLKYDTYYIDDVPEKVRGEAFNRITDQILINKLAVEIKGSFGKMAVNKVIDQDILYRIAIDENKPEVSRIAAINKITDKNMLYSISKIVCHTARIGYNLKDMDNDIKVNLLNRLTPGQLVNLVGESVILEQKLYAVNLLNDQTLLMNISQNNNNLNVRQTAFMKLNDNSLEIISRVAKEPSIILAANIRLGRIDWKNAFSGNSKGNLGVVIGAAALVDNPKPTSWDVILACHNFIKLGDTSRIPELIELLYRYGDIALTEDYLNCGNEDLHTAGNSWAIRHDYDVKSGYGSNRVRWGEGK